MTEPSPSYAVRQPRPHGKPPISLRAPASGPPHSGTARVLAVAVIVLSGLLTTLSVLAGVPLDLVALDLVDLRVSEDTASAVANALVLGSLLVLVSLWVLTALWLRAERRRLGGAATFAHGTAGTLASWVVPFANLVWPYRVVREVHERAVEPRHRVSLASWWTLWLLAVVLDRVSVGFYDQPGSGDPTVAILATSALSSVVLVLALVLWVGIVRRTSRVRT